MAFLFVFNEGICKLLWGIVKVDFFMGLRIEVLGVGVGYFYGKFKSLELEY